jgi:hypothetical protein
VRGHHRPRPRQPPSPQFGQTVPLPPVHDLDSPPMRAERDSPEVTSNAPAPTEPYVTRSGLPKPTVETTSNVASRRDAIALRLTFWLAFGVVLGLAPMLVNSVRSAMSANGLNLTEVLGQGELFIGGAVIAGGAFGELLAAGLTKDFSTKGTTFKVFAILAGCGAMLLLLANTAGYMVNADPLVVRNFSQWFFIATLIPSGAIIGMVATP